MVLAHHDLVRGRVGRKHSLPEHVNHVLRYHTLHFLKHWALVPGVSPRRLRSAFKFVFVRNPLTWYESWWKFMAGHWHPWERNRWHPQRPIDNCGDDDFNKFLSNVLERRPGYLSELYAAYAHGSHFVGKFENLAGDLVRALQAAGETIDASRILEFPAQNVSKAKLGTPNWDPAILARVIAAERQGIERFGYWEEVDAFCQKRVGKPLAAITPSAGLGASAARPARQGEHAH